MKLPPSANDLRPELTDGARNLLALIADKWTVLILIQLCQGPLRFNSLRRCVGPVTPKALAQTLRRLERNGIIARQIIPGSPPGVEYRGTALGFSLTPAIGALLQWSSENLAAVEHAQSEFDERVLGAP